MRIQILNLGYGNGRSLEYVLNRLSGDIFVETLVGIYDGGKEPFPEILLLPGVGNFGLAMEKIREGNWDSYIRFLVQANVKIVGICLGMQLLANSSEESPEATGLGLVPGKVRKLDKSDSRVPNVGWRPIRLTRNSPKSWFEFDAKNFYFTHSYFFDHSEEENVVSTTLHGSHEFTSIVKKDNVYGFQFHLEKSGSEGLELLRRVVYEDEL